MSRAERIGLIGVGRMGLPIARRLAAAGFALTVFDVLPDRAALAGAAVASTAAALAAGSDILITVLPGVSEVERVMLGPDGLVEALPVGTLWIDLTTSDPRVTGTISARAAARGVQSVGAPMAGGVAAAERGHLRFYLGGETSAVRRSRPVLEALGTVESVGTDVGDGLVVKLLSNLLWFGQVVAVTEALLLGTTLGVPLATLRTQLAAGAGGSAFIDEYLDRLLEGDYLTTFGIDRCVEELDILVSLAQGADVPFELSETVARIHRDALERFGAIDGELLAARLLEERAGRVLRNRL